jgi:uncharacterized protein YbaP (TraB family)
MTIRPILWLAAMMLAAQAARAEPAIWLVRSPTATIYLFGTMHILPRPAAWFSPRIAAAFGASTMLIEEADVGLTDPGALQGIMARAVAPDYDIWSKLAPASAAKFRAELEKCHLPDAVVAHFRPWFAAMLPTMCNVMAQTPGVSVAGNSPEAALIAKARAAAKTMDFFETPEQQIGYLSSASEAVQIKELQSAIDDGSAGGDDLAGMEASWQAGDVPAIARLVDQMRVQGGEFYDMIFTRRNMRFAAKIADLLHGDKTVFVAIGAGHLAGPDSVQAQLGKIGITAEKL